MAHIDDHNLAGATTVLTADRQTGLPTLIPLCTDLHAYLKRYAGLSLIIFGLDGEMASLVQPEAAAEGGLIFKIAQMTAEAAWSSEGGRAYRIAADSFALLLPSTSRAAAIRVAEKLRLRIERLGTDIIATFSVASAPEDAGEVGALIAVCEVALICDASGRNRVYAATPVESLPSATARLANLLIARMVALVELGQQLHETEQQALHDPISGLPNSRSFEQTLPRYLERCTRTHTPLAVLLVDGDNLKHYNTTIGYQAGNEWIRRVARTLANHLRPGDYVARWLAGDEFVVLLPSTTANQAIEIAERLRMAVASNEEGAPVGTISIGIALAQDETMTSDLLLDMARDALQGAKQRGKNQVAWLPR